ASERAVRCRPRDPGCGLRSRAGASASGRTGAGHGRRKRRLQPPGSSDAPTIMAAASELPMPVVWGFPTSSDNVSMTDLPRKAVTRTFKLASLPIGVAGRATLGLGKRLGGHPAELVTAQIQQRTADQVFRVLGELKGGAMKFGQALSIFEA